MNCELQLTSIQLAVWTLSQQSSVSKGLSSLKVNANFYESIVLDPHTTISNEETFKKTLVILKYSPHNYQKN